MRDAVRWPLEYFIKTHTAPDELYVQVRERAQEMVAACICSGSVHAMSCPPSHPTRPTPRTLCTTTTTQISDEVDHCYWGPPENLDARLRRSYKVTCENPGSQPGTSMKCMALALSTSAVPCRAVHLSVTTSTQTHT